MLHGTPLYRIELTDDDVISKEKVSKPTDDEAVKTRHKRNKPNIKRVHPLARPL